MVTRRHQGAEVMVYSTDFGAKQVYRAPSQRIEKRLLRDAGTTAGSWSQEACG